ncbi:MAG TPA: MBL fold metallo-hydrolase [Acidimicrobiales bacterium]|nr:MBL fold metallo-hydrolase [Acidimicrobiales bacterium]
MRVSAPTTVPTTTPTTVTLTGTGVPHASPGRAGPGVLVRHGAVALQFDAGRGTVLRLAEAGPAPHEIDAVFLTHVHSDHVVDLADLALTRSIQGTLHPAGPLVIVAPEGETTRFARTMLDPFAADIAVRMAHVQPHPPGLDVRPFALPVPPTGPAEVWRSPDGAVRVEAVAVHHEPVAEAVAYRVTTPHSVVVISGDTRVCDEVRDLARGASLLVHEACRASALRDLIAGTLFEHIFEYHADTVALGALAADAGVERLVLTHLVPAPASDEDAAAFAAEVRSGGYAGPLTVGHDLFTVTLPTETTDTTETTDAGAE